MPRWLVLPLLVPLVAACAPAPPAERATVAVPTPGVLEYRWEIPSPNVPATTVEFTCYPEDGVLEIP